MSQRYRNRSRSRQNDKYRERSGSPHRQSYHKGQKQSKSHKQQSQLNSRQHKQHRSSKQVRKSQQKPQQQSKMLCIEQVDSQYLSELQRKLTDTSISVGTSVFDEVQIKDNMATIKYPSVEVSSSVYKYLKGGIYLGGKQYKLKYWQNKKSDINISYDWYCDKCEYKNFARRGKCHRCDNERNANCKLNYGSQFVTFNALQKKQQIEDAQNCSLMVRGQIITEVQQEALMNLFQSFAPIKDIRMIRNKLTGGNKDFAFVEYYSPQEAAFALRQATAPDFRICGEKATVMYSRTKQDDQFYARPYDKDRRGAPPPRRQTKVSQQTPNYYLRQRQLQIQQQKKRPLITLQQLKQKHENQLKKALPQQKQMSEQQNQRRKAEMLAKQWQKEIKMQSTVLYICPLCIRKFKNQQQMNQHAKLSQLHKYRLARLQKQLLAL